MSDFKLANTPRECDASDSLIKALSEIATVPELFFHTKKRHHYTFEQVPVGHDTGWRCFDPSKYDGDPADGDTTCGYGLTQDEALADYLNNREEPKEPLARPGKVIHSSPFEPPTVVPGRPDEWEHDDSFDTDLEPQR